MMKDFKMYAKHLITCNLMQDWSEADDAFANTPNEFRDHEYYEAVKEMNIKRQTCTCGLDELLNSESASNGGKEDVKAKVHEIIKEWLPHTMRHSEFSRLECVDKILQIAPSPVPPTSLSAEEMKMKIRDILDKKAKDQFNNSGSFSATPFGLDGIPFVRWNAIVDFCYELMTEYASSLLTQSGGKYENLKLLFDTMMEERQMQIDSITQRDDTIRELREEMDLRNNYYEDKIELLNKLLSQQKDI